jgi:hypothetical protein
MSYAPSFRAPGGHIFDVVVLVLKKHVFSAMLAQHVASELRMRLWMLRSLTDRNTPSRLKIYLGKSGYNGFLVVTDITDFIALWTVTSGQSPTTLSRAHANSSRGG